MVEPFRFLLWSAGYADGEANQRSSRFSSRPARRWRDGALPRWFGRTVSPNFRERYLRRSSALAPLACALTAFSVTSPSDAAGACRRACASGFLTAAAVFTGLCFGFTAATFFPPKRP